MYTGKISFTSLPDIGFAMQHTRMHYSAVYGNKQKKCIEVAYINSGSISLCLNGDRMHAPEGSVVVLFRHLPISTKTVGDGVHSHYTVLGEFEDLDFVLGDKEIPSDQYRLEIPFVTKPSAKTEKIGIEIRRIVSDMTKERDSKEFCASVAFVSILKELSDIYASGNDASLKTNEKNVSIIKRYIEDNFDRSITIGEIASHIGKSPNYTGQLFRKYMGMTVAEYINLQKMKKVSLLIKEKQMTFSDACSSVSICDSSYGYRLFKKHIGLTPREFLEANSIRR